MKISRCAALKFKNPIRKRLIYFFEATAQLVTEKDRKISPLSQLVTEKDRKISPVFQLVTEKDRKISPVFQLVTEKDRKIWPSRPGAREDRDAFADSPFNR